MQPAVMGNLSPLETPVGFAGAYAAPAVVEPERAEADELDIPAFLRRGNS